MNSYADKKITHISAISNTTVQNHYPSVLDKEIKEMENKQIFSSQTTSAPQDTKEKVIAFKDRLSKLHRPDVTKEDVLLAIKFLESRDIMEIAGWFGLEDSVNNSYHVVSQIMSVDKSKPFEENDEFMITLETNYGDPEFTPILSRENVLHFSALQSESEANTISL